MPLVAVIVPVFNRLDMLRQTVASLRAQSLANAEFILIDDHSDDATWNFLQGLADVDPRFRILRKPAGVPKGCQSSRNLGLSECRAEAVVFLDSDDLLTPNCLETRHRELSDHPEADILVGRQAMFWDATGEMRWVNVPRPGSQDLARCLDLYDPLDVPWINGGVMIRSHRLNEMGIRWSTDYHWDDLAFHFSCLVNGLRVHWMAYGIQPPDCYYRKHGGDHYGHFLQTAEGIRNSADMMLWMKRELQRTGQWTQSQRRRLARSYFHVSVLRVIDQCDGRLARQWIERACNQGLFSKSEFSRLCFFSVGRQVLCHCPRVTYFWNRVARRTYLKELFLDAPWTYGTLATPSPASQQGLANLLAACSGISHSAL
jgi:glycosyltransferase involved in cell wall biosynthesis